jgi:hypothetical protein
MTRILTIIAALGLAACAPQVPDSGAGAGVGFQDYDSYLAQQRARDQALRTGQPVAIGAPVAPASDAVVVVQQTPEQQTASAAVAAIGGTQPDVQTQVAATSTPRADNPDLSDEQDFQAVSSRQTIQSDAQRRANQSAQYEVVAPKAVPSRPRNSVQTPIEFAVATSHPIGQKVYRRSPFSSDKSARACAKYTSGEAAQDAFMKSGGPKRDKLGLDPDGDGYACRWDPSVYRVAQSN